VVKCEGSLPKTKGKTHYMVKMRHIAETNMMKEAELKLEEQNKNINTKKKKV